MSPIPYLSLFAPQLKVGTALTDAVADTASEGAMSLTATAAGRQDEYRRERARVQHEARVERQRARLTRNLAVAGGAALVLLLLIVKGGKSNG